MSAETTTLRSRRALLGAGLGAAAATALSAVQVSARPPVVPAQTSPVLLDVNNPATSLTSISTTTVGAFSAVSNHATALAATTTDGFALKAHGGSGFALSTLGRLDISTAGLATIPAGATSKLVYGGVDITASSFVLLTPNADIGTRRLWWTKDTVGNSITIHLSSSRTSPTKVSFLILG